MQIELENQSRAFEKAASLISDPQYNHFVHYGNCGNSICLHLPTIRPMAVQKEPIRLKASMVSA